MSIPKPLFDRLLSTAAYAERCYCACDINHERRPNTECEVEGCDTHRGVFAVLEELEKTHDLVERKS
jgi:hypothetical protein